MGDLLRAAGYKVDVVGGAGSECTRKISGRFSAFEHLLLISRSGRAD
jgi:hypothetical protein